MKRAMTFALLVTCLVTFGATDGLLGAGAKAKAKGSATKAKAGAAKKMKPQETCPVMGGKIKKDCYTDVGGYRIYMCCPGCEKKIKEDPEKALAALKAKGERVKMLPVKPQENCPVMTEDKIKKSMYVDAAGYRIYTCCKNCIKKVQKEPLKAVAKLRLMGQGPEVRMVVCGKCGEIAGTPKCCKKNADKCAKCEMAKGSPGCCQDLKAAAKDGAAVLCGSCGQFKGAAGCCAKDAEKCTKCGLAKGSPGCCKIPRKFITKPATKKKKAA